MTKEREYFEKSVAITTPAGDHIFEFLIELRDQVGVFEKIVEVFTKHDAYIRTVSAAPEEGEHKFVTNIFADFSKANCTADALLEELRRLSFVRKAYSADMRGRLFDRFLFPVKIMNEDRVLLMRVGPLLNIEKRLVDQMGSAGAAIMYEEGKSYAGEAFKQYKSALPNASIEDLLENIKDGLRVTGWGIFGFKRVPDGFEVTVMDPPHLDNYEHKENRFFFGVTEKILEELYGDELTINSSDLDIKNRRLVIQFKKRSL
jgi:hypothetical protein